MVPGSGDGLINITFQVVGGPEINRSLATWGAHITDMSDAWQQVGEDLLASFRDNFTSEGGGFGGWSSWAPLAPSTVADRARLGYGGEHPILQRTGALMESLTRQGAPGNVFEVGPNSLTVGTEIYYAPFHQFGTAQHYTRHTFGAEGYIEGELISGDRHFGTYRLSKGAGSRMPARPIVGLSWDMQSQIVNRLNTYVQSVARQQGLMP